MGRMIAIKLNSILVAGLVFMGAIGHLFGQTKQQDRRAVFAGQFYPADQSELHGQIKEFFDHAVQSKQEGPVRALIVPHAGYTFSGSVAASAYKQLADLNQYKNIFIIASSHRVSLGKASVYTAGNYLTPLGVVPVNLELARKISQRPGLCFDPSAHSEEHSIEVQLPFIQFFEEFPPIIPIVLASQVPEAAEQLADALRPWFKPENLFIISADFSHYPSYEEAYTSDRLTADAFCSGKASVFLDYITQSYQKKVKGLATPMCAWPAALSLLYLSENEQGMQFEKLDYKNSGDHPDYGDKRRVVGYQTIALRDTNPPEGFYLSNTAKSELLELARKALVKKFHPKEFLNQKPVYESALLNQQAGAFVTIRINGKLRGCIGRFDPQEPLFKLIPELSVSAAFHDTRFLPLQERELTEIQLEISILSPLKRIKDIHEIELGKHGIYLSKGSASGTFLPQVALETGWSLEEFLGHCAKDKAGLGFEGWKDAEIYIYEALIFKEL